MKLNFEVVADCNDENDNATCWVAEINHEEYGKFIWITNIGKAFAVEFKNEYDDIETLKEFRGFKSAEKWANEFLG